MGGEETLWEGDINWCSGQSFLTLTKSSQVHLPLGDSGLKQTNVSSLLIRNDSVLWEASLSER